MRLKKEENLRLLRSCTQVKIIELTEKIAKLNKRQEQLLSNDSDLRVFISGIYKAQNTDKDISDTTPISESELIKTDLKDFKNYNPDKAFAPVFKTYHYNNRKLQNFSKSLEEYRDFADKLYGHPIKPDEVQAFIDSEKHTPSFSKFAKGVQTHSPMHLGYAYKKLAENIAERNDIKDKDYTTKADRAFTINRATLNLNRNFKGRLKNTGTKLAIAGALSAAVIAGSIMFSKDTDVPQGEDTSTTIIDTDDIAQTIPTEEPIEEQTSIFTNSVTDMNTYEDACKDYFEKISDIYRYNSGKEIDLSGYGQKQIGYNGYANVFIVELDGQTYTISGQGHSPSNLKYLQQALETTGGKVTQVKSSLSCIIDKNDSSRSIAITDSLGNPVRSGIVLTGSNNAYNPQYVNAGKKILEEQGKTNCSEAECVGAYLLSDEHAGDPELSDALGQVQNLAYFIKNSFYERTNGQSDPYTVYLYQQKSQKFAQTFDAKIHSQLNQNQTIAEATINEKNSKDEMERDR